MQFSTIRKGEQPFTPSKCGVFFELVQTPDRLQKSEIRPNRVDRFDSSQVGFYAFLTPLSGSTHSIIPSGFSA